MTSGVKSTISGASQSLEAESPLSTALRPWFGTDMESLPPEVRDVVVNAQGDQDLWDGLTADQREAWAAQIDARRGPSLKAKRQRMWDHLDAVDELEGRRDALKALTPTTPTHFRHQREEFELIEARLAELAAQGRIDVLTRTSKATQAAEKVARQDARLAACEAQGMAFDKASLARVPDGIGAVAKTLGIERQSLTVDVKAALKRRFEAARTGKG